MCSMLYNGHANFQWNAIEILLGIEFYRNGTTCLDKILLLLSPCWRFRHRLPRIGLSTAEQICRQTTINWSIIIKAMFLIGINSNAIYRLFLSTATLMKPVNRFAILLSARRIFQRRRISIQRTNARRLPRECAKCGNDWRDDDEVYD